MDRDMNFDKTHARTGDPETSKAAAKAAKNFYKTHAGKIYAALVLHGPMTAHEIAHVTELTVVQIDRRLPDLKEAGRAEPFDEGISDSGRKARIWRAV